MRGDRRRRRLRVRRKRKEENFLWEAADAAFDSGDAVEVVGQFGCCLIEAVGSAAVLAALLTIPTYLLMR